MSPTRKAAAKQRRVFAARAKRGMVLDRVIKSGQRLGFKVFPNKYIPRGVRRPNTFPCFRRHKALILKHENTAGGALGYLFTCTGCANTFVSRLQASGTISQTDIDNVTLENPCNALKEWLVPLPFELEHSPCLIDFGSTGDVLEVLTQAEVSCHLGAVQLTGLEPTPATDDMPFDDEEFYDDHYDEGQGPDY